MKWVELTEFSSGEKIFVNVENIDFMVRVDEVTSLRINGDEFLVVQSPEKIIDEIARTSWRTLND